MKSNYKRLGDLIENINLRNEQKQVSKLLGVNLEKQLIPSIANIVGTDLSTYKIIKKGQFACKLMSVGRDGVLPVGYLADYDEAIVSPAYYVFQVKEKDLLLPEFLMLCMKRNEFDRELWFSSGGDVRGGATWENLNEIMIPVPPIEEQEKIVDAYETIEKRIALKRKINQNLAETLNTIFNNLYQDIDDENTSTFSELCSLASSKRVFAEDYASEGIPFYRGKEITQKRNGEPINDPLYISIEHYETLRNNYGVPSCGDILITAVGTIGNSYLVQDEDFYFKDGNIIWLKDFRNSSLNYYLYDYMQTSIFKRELEGICIGSTQTALTIVALSNLKVKVPEKSMLKAYCANSRVIRNTIQINNAEIFHLTMVAQSILVSLS